MISIHGCDIDIDGISVGVLNPHELLVLMSHVREAARTIVEYVCAEWCDEPTVTMYPDLPPSGGWTWWAYPSKCEPEPEDNGTSWLHADGAIECYGISQECEGES